MTPAPISADRLALRACRLFETSDLDDAEDRISRVMQPHRLRRHARGGGARSHMDFVRLHGVGLGTIAFGPGRIEVPPLDDYHLVVFCLTGHASLTAGAEEVAIDNRHGVLCPAGTPLAGQFSPECEQFVVRMESSRLIAFTGQEPPRQPARMDLRSPRLLPWVAALRTLVTDPATLAMVRSHADVASDYEQLLLRLLLAGQLAADPAPRRMPAGATVRPASVRRATAFIAAHLTAPLTLADIAAAACVPERTLHDAYCRFEGVSPMRALRDLRLDRVRAALLAKSDGAGVTGAALAAGFTHLGRFALAYADRFGERPSDTLRQRQPARGRSSAS